MADDTPAAVHGGFISDPKSFSGAPDDFRNAVKLWYRPALQADGTVGLDVCTTALLMDFKDLNAKFDAVKLAADCDLLKKAVQSNTADLESILSELQKGTFDGAAKARKILEGVGLSEKASGDAGGGFVMIIVVAAAMALAGCGGALKEKAASSSTTPKQPNPPNK